MPNALVFVRDGEEPEPLSKDAGVEILKIAAGEKIKLRWDRFEGIVLNLNPIRANATTYTATIQLSLRMTPPFSAFNEINEPIEKTEMIADTQVDVQVTFIEEEKAALTFLDFFPDENLAQGVAIHYGRVATESVTQEELENRREELSLNGLGITNLDGMQYFIHLEALSLNSNELADLSPISNLNQLRLLALENNQISDLEPLRGMNVTNLWLASNLIETIEPLSGLENLKNLSLKENQIVDIMPLTDLQLNHNHILDLSPVGYVENLSAYQQWVILAPTTPGTITEEIFIRNRGGQAPSTIIFNPAGGIYLTQGGIIIWPGVGENTLS